MIAVNVNNPGKEPADILRDMVRALDRCAETADARYAWWQKRLGIHAGARMAQVYGLALRWLVINDPAFAAQHGYGTTGGAR